MVAGVVVEDRAKGELGTDWTGGQWRSKMSGEEEREGGLTLKRRKDVRSFSRQAVESLIASLRHPPPLVA